MTTGITDHEAKLLHALAEGKTLCYRGADDLTDLSREGALRHLINGNSAHLRVKPIVVNRFIPVHRMPGGSIVMTEAKCERKYATDDAYNGRDPSEKQVGVIHAQIDSETLELVSASMEKL
jgi:hypothetical protein